MGSLSNHPSLSRGEKKEKGCGLHDLLAMGDFVKALTPSSTLDDPRRNTLDTRPGEKRRHQGNLSNWKDRKIEPTIVSSSAIRLRLPLLLRYLSALQHNPYNIHSSSKIVPDVESARKVKSDGGEMEEEQYTRIMQTTVALLECVAATHATAEEMEVLVSYLVPKLSKQFFVVPGAAAQAPSSSLTVPLLGSSKEKFIGSSGSNLLSLRRITPSHPYHTPDEAVWRCSWDKEPLEQALSRWAASTSQVAGKRAGGEECNTEQSERAGDEDLQDIDIGGMSDPEEEQVGPSEGIIGHTSVQGKIKKRRALSPTNTDTSRKGKSSLSLSMLQQSQEASVSKALMELTSLVLASLDERTALQQSRGNIESDIGPGKNQFGNLGEDGSPNDTGLSSHSRVSFVLPTKPDSLWVEYSSNVGGSAANGGTDLAAIISAVMYCCPVLRHVHVVVSFFISDLLSLSSLCGGLTAYLEN
jgi:hypothetical protein